MGLNSTWQQYRAGDFERKLAIPTRQLQAALPAGDGGDPLEIFRPRPRALLMMHHPPGWLSRRGREQFDEAIYSPQRFDLCLFGHLHEGRSASEAVSGGTPRYYFQAPSLFGLEHYGTVGWSSERSRRESRAPRPAAGGRASLADLLPRHRRLLLEGQPGAGKTTFLRLAASSRSSATPAASGNARSW